MLTLGLDSVPLHDIVVVVSSFESCLHLGELVLHAVELNTGVLTRLAHLTDFFLFFAKLEVDALVFSRQLLGQGILETDHQDLKHEELETVVGRTWSAGRKVSPPSSKYWSTSS